MKSEFETKPASFFLTKIEAQLAKWRDHYSQVGQNYITILDKAYPDSLKQIYDPPLFLFYRGNLDLLKSNRLLTIVGSRQSTGYHTQTTRSLVNDLRKFDFVIASGLAYGIDSVSHQAALASGLKTVAVIGSGLGADIIYPAANRKLAQTIVAQGGLLLSEHPDSAKPELHFFPRRNRVLAAISRATLVISGAAKSGTLITAQCALDQGRDVLALPGNINMSLCQGPNELIKNGAIPVLASDDIILVYGLKPESVSKVVSLKDKKDAKIYTLLQTEPMSTDQLCQKTGWPFGEISICVTKLEMAGYIYLNNHNQFEIR